MGTPSAISLGSDSISVDDSLPSFISQNLINKNQRKLPKDIKNQNNLNNSNNNNLTKSNPTSPQSKQPITITFDDLIDKNLNYSQKERISEGILRGTIPLPLPLELQLQTQQLSQSQSQQTQLRSQQQQLSARSKKRFNNQQPRHEFDQKSHSDAHLNRHLYNQRLLGVVSHSALLLPPELKDKQHEIDRKKYLTQGQSEYRWGPKSVPVVPLHVPKSNSQNDNSNEVPEGYMTRAEIIAESKKYIFILLFFLFF